MTCRASTYNANVVMTGDSSESALNIVLLDFLLLTPTQTFVVIPAQKAKHIQAS